jgi:hypothetical protein
LTGHPPPTEPAWVCRAALPTSAHPGAKKALAQIWDAQDLVALVRAAAIFVNGTLIERPGENIEPEAA